MNHVLDNDGLFQVSKSMEMEPDKKGSVAEVRDVDWAPSMGRPMHLIAAATGTTVQVCTAGILFWCDGRK